VSGLAGGHAVPVLVPVAHINRPYLV